MNYFLFILNFFLKNKPYDMTMEKRDFLLMLKRLQLVDSLHLTASRIITILADEDPNVRPSGTTNPTDIRLDIEASFFLLIINKN